MRLLYISFLLFGTMNIAIGEDMRNIEQVFDPSARNIIQDSTFHYLALGDSYSAGTSVRLEKSFPHQLANRLRKDTQKKVITQVIAKAGWRTDELLDSLRFGTSRSSYDIVTLWIGVNNQYQKRPFNKYKKEFPLLLTQAIKLARGDASRVFIISIPDWGYTPFGEKDGRKNISKEIDKYNTFARNKAKEYKAAYISIVDISRESLRDANLVARDGLHPSGMAYKRFLERICPIVTKVLN